MALKTAHIQEPYCLFLVGMQCRSWLSFWKIPFISYRMFKMQKELRQDKTSGFLWGKNFIAYRPFTSLFLTYWKSSDDIHRFVSDKKFSHLASVGIYYRKYRNDPNIGVWHETYEVTPGQVETLYYGMNPFGAGSFNPITPLERNAKGYMKRLRGDSTETK